MQKVDGTEPLAGEAQDKGDATTGDETVTGKDTDVYATEEQFIADTRSGVLSYLRFGPKASIHDAEEVAQDACKSVLTTYWRRRGKRQKSELRRLLITSALHGYRDLLRKQQGRRAVFSFDEQRANGLADASSISSSASGTPLDLAIREEQHARLWDAIESLVMIDREIIVLRFMANLTLAETGQIFGLTIGQVNYRSSVIISTLRDILSEEDQ
ncbi:MAG: sigma-70 family RNA polymerase sigma factor [Woeseiaceae bacterium]|nr:sigma-70 family RNA polymerase sigma factor [Woeseiaceae bacterium]